MSIFDNQPSYNWCVAKALREANQPLNLDEIVLAASTDRPNGKAAPGAVYRALNKVYQAVPVGGGRYGWLSHLLNGAIVCHPLTSEEITGGHLLLDELEHTVFFPEFFQNYRPDGRVVTVKLFGGPTIEAIAAIEQKTWSLQLGEAFVHWLDKLGVENRDDILIHVQDADEGKYELRARLREMRDDEQVEQRNIRLALLAEDIVAEESAARPIIPTWDLVAMIIGRGFYRNSTPTDDLHYVLGEYSNLRFIEGKGYELAEAKKPLQLSHGYSIEEARDVLSELLADWHEREARLASGPNHGPRVTYDHSLEKKADELDGFDALGAEDDGSEYDSYLEQDNTSEDSEYLLGSDVYPLLEAELAMLLQIEKRFGNLLAEQRARVDYLVVALSIDIENRQSQDWDATDDSGYGEPPSWQN